MEIEKPLKTLPQNFRQEHKQLLLKGIDTWRAIKDLNVQELQELTKGSLATIRNLKRLRGIAVLVCDLKLKPEEAALLMHSGIATISALAEASPQEVLNKTGRFERQLKSDFPSTINLAKAHEWIQRARARQKEN